MRYYPITVIYLYQGKQNISINSTESFVDIKNKFAFANYLHIFALRK